MRLNNIKHRILPPVCFSSFLVFVFMLFFVSSSNAGVDTITYTYYNTGELKKAIYIAGQTVEYVYDDSGNRLSKAVSFTKPTISVSPLTVWFGTILAGNISAVQNIAASNVGSGVLDIDRIGISGSNPTEFFVQNDTCSGASLQPSGTCSISMLFSPSIDDLSLTATLDIVSNAPDGPFVQVNLEGGAILPVNQHALTVTKAGTGSGSIGVDTGTLNWINNIGTAIYPLDSYVNISASAASDSKFSGWSGDCIGNGSPCPVQMSIERLVIATFNLKTDFSGTPNTGPVPLAVSFNDASTHSPTSWLWDFGDGATSTLQNPVHIYQAQGSYTVSLTATGTGGAVTRTKINFISVSSCTSQPVKIGGTSFYYSSVQSAYNLSAEGESVQMQALDFTEDLNLQNNTSVILQGGYECDYSSNPGFTTLYGTFAIDQGTVTIENLIIQ